MHAASRTKISKCIKSTRTHLAFVKRRCRKNARGDEELRRPGLTLKWLQTHLRRGDPGTRCRLRAKGAVGASLSVTPRKENRLRSCPHCAMWWRTGRRSGGAVETRHRRDMPRRPLTLPETAPAD